MFICNINSIPASFYLFCYGSNNIQQMAERLKQDCELSQKLFDASKPLKLYGYKREFFGSSRKWDCAVATLTHYPNTSKFVAGFMFRIDKSLTNYKVGNTQVNFQNLLDNEAFPNKYVLGIISFWGGLPVLAFVKNPDYRYTVTKPVKLEYIKAISRTIRDYRLLKARDDTSYNGLYDSYVIDINYVNNVMSSSHMTL